MLDMSSDKKTKFKFLCINHEVCEEVRNILGELKFTDLKDHKDSEHYDISGKHTAHGRVKIDNIIKSIFEKTNEKIVSIEISHKG